MSEQAQNLNENEELVEDVQQETTSTEDPLEEAIARVQELEEQLKAQVKKPLKKSKIYCFARVLKLTICAAAVNKTSKKHIICARKILKRHFKHYDNLERALATPANKEDENIKALFDGVELT